jgi:hypothetical protein
MIRTGSRIALFALLATCSGCGSSPPPSPPIAPAATPTAPVAAAPQAPVATPVAAPVEAPAEDDAPLPTISLGGSKSPTTGSSATKTTSPTAAAAVSTVQNRRKVVAAMNALQVMLGSWKGTTNKEFGEFKALENPSWVWDFRSQPGQPALMLKSEKSQYVTEARLTYLTDRDIYQMTAKDKEGQTHTLEGQFAAPVEEFEGDDRRVHRKYKLLLTEVGDAKDALQLILNQQDNNRYLLEVERKRGNRFMRVDTIGSQRDGSSFASNDSDYKDRTCVISAGLGTTQVSFNGKSYWVCCSGCKAAFDEDPARWVAEFEAKQKEKAQGQPGS